MAFIILFFTSLNLFSTTNQISTPYSAVYNHLKYLQEDSFNPEKSSKSFYIEDKEKAIEIAKKLKRYLDANGKFVELDKIPTTPNYIDSLTGNSVFYLFKDDENVFLEKINDNWYYSRFTSSITPKLYESIFPIGLKKILSYLPDFVNSKFIGLEFWKIIGLLVYLILSLVLYLSIKGLINRYVLRLLNKIIRGNITLKPISNASSPLSIVLVLYILSNMIVYLMLPINLSKILSNIINFLYPFLLTIVFYRITELVAEVFERIAERTETTTDDQLVPLVSKSIKVVVVVVGSFYIVDSTGVDYTPLLAGASIGGLALALAAQDTVKNFFGSVTIFTDKPFDVGDWIVFGSHEGTVEEVGVRSTRVRTFYNSLVSIPNGKISDMTIDNMGKRRYRRYTTKLNVRYDIPIVRIEEYVEKLKGIVANLENTRKDYFEIHINDLSDSSIQILIYIFFEVENWTEELKSRQKFIVEALKLAEVCKVKFAYPTQSIQIEKYNNDDIL